MMSKKSEVIYAVHVCGEHERDCVYDIDGVHFHVTSRRGGWIYGHSTKHCNESGCGCNASIEWYLGIDPGAED